MKGFYKGFYRYDNEKMQKCISNDQTFFCLEVNETDGKKFSGTVEDDISSGGMSGVGKISGELKGNEITFIKQMPVASFRKIKDGQRLEFNKNHPKIYYKGVKTNEKFTGTWVIKFNFFMVGLMLIIGVRTKGTWEMERINKR